MLTLLLTILAIASAACTVIPTHCGRFQARPSQFRSCWALKNRGARRPLEALRAMTPQNSDDSAKFHAHWSEIDKKLKSNASSVTVNDIAALLHAFPEYLHHHTDTVSLATRFAKVMDTISKFGMFTGHEDRLDEFLVNDKVIDSLSVLHVAMINGDKPRMYLTVAMLLRAWHFYFPDPQMLDIILQDIFSELLENDIKTAVLLVRRFVTFVQEDIDELPSRNHGMMARVSLLNQLNIRSHFDMDYALLKRCLDAVIYIFTLLDLSNEQDKMTAFYKALNEKGVTLMHKPNEKHVFEWRVKGLDGIGTIPVKRGLMMSLENEDDDIWVITDSMTKLSNSQQQQ